ncbi:MAG: pilus assembly protein CpaF [Planctomycetes bacterium GWF2_42_9]|nr:MAG: pilus assembly protein CpaF [Planctomycetes bacterium GWF2_42_9]
MKKNPVWHNLKEKVHLKLLSMIDLHKAKEVPIELLRSECSRKIDSLLCEQDYPLSAPEKDRLVCEVMNEVFGFGPLEQFLNDQDVSDVLVNGPKQVYIEKFGRLSLTEASFSNSEHLMRVISRIASNVGRRIDESVPMLDARLPDGSRVNAIIPPLALDGPMLSIRRFGAHPLSINRLIEIKSLTKEMAYFLEACVRCRMNMLISGGTGTGKTTLLNALSHWIPRGQRVVTIEDAAELKLQRDHVVRLETRPPNIEGKGLITQRDLLRNSLRMRPDRIIIGEVRGDETLDMLQAMNTGHEGSMTTVHANSPRDALRRLENMVSMAGINYPVRAMREQISSALNVLVHIDRVTGGQRKIACIAEITGTEGDVICLHDIFKYSQLGIDENGNAYGQFETCGVRPNLVNRLKSEGMDIPAVLFQRQIVKESDITASPEKDREPVAV